MKRRRTSRARRHSRRSEATGGRTCRATATRPQAAGVARGRGHHRGAQRGLGPWHDGGACENFAGAPPSSAATEWKEHVVEIFTARGPSCPRSTLGTSSVMPPRRLATLLLKLAVASGVIQNMCSHTSRSTRDTAGLALICPSPSLGSWKRHIRSCPKPSECFASYMDLRAQHRIRHCQRSVKLSTSLGYQSLTRSLSLPSTKLSSKWCTVTRLHMRVQATLARLWMRTGPRCTPSLGELQLDIIRNVFDPFRRLLIGRSAESKCRAGCGGRRTYRMEVAASGEFEPQIPLARSSWQHRARLVASAT